MLDMMQNKEITLAVIAIVTALGLIGVMAVDSFTLPKVDAAGCTNSVAFNASKGRCFGH